MLAFYPYHEYATFFDVPDIDLIATKGPEVLAISIRLHDGKDEESQVTVSGRIRLDYSLSLLREAEGLLSPQSQRAALLMSWIAFEAAAREVLKEELPRSTFAPGVLNELLSKNFINRSQFEMLRHARHVRNMIVHGIESDELSPEIISFLLGLVRKLKHPQLMEQLQFHGGASATIIRKGVNQNPRLLKQVEVATRVLGEVLGASRSLVSMDWDQGEDGQGQPIVILKLSDFTGTVAATFTPEELVDEVHMRTRLYGLWGDLLQIRNKERLERITGKKGDA
ncbi:hypothetical protein SAMN05444166_1429 [Singulisphaera sp. GP187]|nr:hypothetical protein SAMN05444166_1429 [Singulisphaera sp. GP187]